MTTSNLKPRLCFLLPVVALLTGCATHAVGRYVTTVTTGSVIMTDTQTGQVWISGITAPGVLADESFKKAKSQ